MGQVFDGETGNAPILGAKFWIKGGKLSGTVGGKFQTRNGECTTIMLDTELSLDGNILNPPVRGTTHVKAISIGNMKGFENAVMMSGCLGLRANDHVEIVCTGEQDTGQESPMVTFKVKVVRP